MAGVPTAGWRERHRGAGGVGGRATIPTRAAQGRTVPLHRAELSLSHEKASAPSSTDPGSSCRCLNLWEAAESRPISIQYPPDPRDHPIRRGGACLARKQAVTANQPTPQETRPVPTDEVPRPLPKANQPRRKLFHARPRRAAVKTTDKTKMPPSDLKDGVLPHLRTPTSAAATRLPYTHRALPQEEHSPAVAAAPSGKSP